MPTDSCLPTNAFSRLVAINQSITLTHVNGYSPMNAVWPSKADRSFPHTTKMRVLNFKSEVASRTDHVLR